MAKSDRTTRITTLEIFALADRLNAHAQGQMFQVFPAIKKDVLLAARILRHTLEHGVITAPLDLQ